MWAAPWKATGLLYFIPRAMRGVGEGTYKLMLLGRGGSWLHAKLKAVIREALPFYLQNLAGQQLLPQTEFSSSQGRTFQCAEPLGW